MTRSEIIRSLRDEYARQRETNRREHERRIREVNQKDPEIGKITDASHTLFQNQTRLLIACPAQAETIAQSCSDGNLSTRINVQDSASLDFFAGRYHHSQYAISLFARISVWRITCRMSCAWFAIAFSASIGNIVQQLFLLGASSYVQRR